MHIIQCVGKIFCVVPFEIPHKISYPYIDDFYTVLKFLRALEFKSSKVLLKYPSDVLTPSSDTQMTTNCKHISVIAVPEYQRFYAILLDQISSFKMDNGMSDDFTTV